MKTLFLSVGLLLVGATSAVAQDAAPDENVDGQPTWQFSKPQAGDSAQPQNSAQQTVQPPTAAPADLPPAPPAQPPSPPQAKRIDPNNPGSQAAPDQNSATGQWVYTQQYGWIWMPYGNQYVNEGSANDENPYQYVYYPTSGWGWYAAPWLWGWGAYPYFGVWGPGRFGWYRGLSRAGYGWGGYRGGGAWAGRGGGWGGNRGGWGGGYHGGNTGGGAGAGWGNHSAGVGASHAYGHSAPAPHPTYSPGGAFHSSGGGFHGGGGGGHGGGGGGHR